MYVGNEFLSAPLSKKFFIYPFIENWILDWQTSSSTTEGCSIVFCLYSFCRETQNCFSVHLYIMYCLSLTTFRIFSLIFRFSSLILMHLGVGSLKFMCFQLHWAWIYIFVFFTRVEKFLVIISSDHFSISISSSSPSRTQILPMLDLLILFQKIPRLCSRFSIFCCFSY